MSGGHGSSRDQIQLKPLGQLEILCLLVFDIVCSDEAGAILAVAVRHFMGAGEGVTPFWWVLRLVFFFFFFFFYFFFTFLLLQIGRAHV